MPRYRDADRSLILLDLLSDEMKRQDRKWGWPRSEVLLESSLALAAKLTDAEEYARHLLDKKTPWFALEKKAGWLAILAEEIGEVSRENDPQQRITELIQVAAVSLSWAQAIQENVDGD